MALELLAATSLFTSQLGTQFSEIPSNCFEPVSKIPLDKSNSFSCEACNRQFTSKRNLVDHYRGHHQATGRKPHACTFPGCGKSFLRPAHLLIHTRIHTGEKPFVCTFEGCGKRWNQKSALKQHMRSHTGEKPFRCTVQGCDKRFSTSSSCKRHILTHDTSKIHLLVSQTRKRERVDSVDEQPTKKRFCALPLLEVIESEKPILDPGKMTIDFLLN